MTVVCGKVRDTCSKNQCIHAKAHEYDQKDWCHGSFCILIKKNCLCKDVKNDKRNTKKDIKKSR